MRIILAFRRENIHGDPFMCHSTDQTPLPDDASGARSWSAIEIGRSVVGLPGCRQTTVALISRQSVPRAWALPVVILTQPWLNVPDTT